jgi:hypothetical protein
LTIDNNFYLATKVENWLPSLIQLSLFLSTPRMSSVNPFGDLSVENHEQIRRYIRFFRQKKDGMLRQISNEFADAKSDKLHEDMFTRDDMEEFSDFLASAVRVS